MRRSRRLLNRLAGLMSRRGLVGAVMLTTAGLAGASAHAEVPGTLLLDTQGINPDPAVNGRYLRDAITLGTSALERLQGPRAIEDLPSTHKTIDLMYRTVRTALFGMRQQKMRAKYDDPLLDYQLARTERAWNTVRAPVDSYFNSLPPEVYIEGAVRDVSAAISILRPVVAVMP